MNLMLPISLYEYLFGSQVHKKVFLGLQGNVEYSWNELRSIHVVTSYLGQLEITNEGLYS